MHFRNMVGFVPLFKLLDFFLNLLFFFSLYLIIFYLSLFRKSNFLNIFVPKCFGFSLLKLIVFLPDNLLNFFLIFFWISSRFICDFFLILDIFLKINWISVDYFLPLELERGCCGLMWICWP